MEFRPCYFDDNIEKSECVMKRMVLFLLVSLLLTGCGARATATSEPVTPTVELITTSAPLPPTETLVPTTTATVVPTPDLSTIGLPSEPAGTVAYDFVDQMCAAQWYNREQSLPCPGDVSQAKAGYVQQFYGEAEGVPADFPMLLTYPPGEHYSTLSSLYPPFTIQKGDRFRAIFACKVRSFCDVEFVLNYFHGHGQQGLNHWHYLFTDAPKVIDFPLDKLAGQTVQFDLAVAVVGNRPDTYAVWVAPHIYRPAP
jgi:hypothetical protein